MDNARDLEVLLKSRHGLILAETDDEERFLDIVRLAADELELPVWTWSSTRGLVRDGQESAQYQTVHPHYALDFVAYLEGPGVYVFVDAHPILEDPKIVRRVKEIGQTFGEGQALVLTAPAYDVPIELDGLARTWSLRPPNRQELRDLTDRTLADLERQGTAIDLENGDIDEIVTSLQGLSLRQAERLIQHAALEDGAVTAADVPRIRAAKAEQLMTGGVLELIESHTTTLDGVGGFNGLKHWLGLRRQAFLEDVPGLDRPRGLLMTGVPGCGKSLAAKAVAKSWGIPLVLLDPARLYSKYIGESEERLSKALSTVDALSPAVLWIDEIEKGFAAGGTADGGLSTRLLGTFLRWMQERTSRVFLMATANDVSALPPELLRKGRFDEIFFVDLPGDTTRHDVLRLQLTARELDPADFDLDKLVELTHGFSGAEIEMAIVGGLYRAHAAGAGLSEADLVTEVDSTVPLSVSRAEDVARLRAWATARAVPA